MGRKEGDLSPAEYQRLGKTQGPHKKRIKKSVLLFLVILVAIVLSVIIGGIFVKGNVSEEAKREAERIVDAFEKKNIQDITRCVYGEWVSDEEIDSSGLMDTLFERTEIELSSITKDTITYTVTAADVSNVFNDWGKDGLNLDEIDEDAFVAHIAEYVEKADLETEKITVSYVIEDGVFLQSMHLLNFSMQ